MAKKKVDFLHDLTAEIRTKKGILKNFLNSIIYEGGVSQNTHDGLSGSVGRSIKKNIYLLSKKNFTLIDSRRIMILGLSKKEVIMSVTRYKENPFMKDMQLSIKNKKIKVSPIGKDENILINQNTGEIFGTHITTYKPVDGEQFIKLFTANIGLTFDLTSSGIKAFTVLIWAVQHRALGKDEVDLDMLVLNDFIFNHKDEEKPLRLSEPTFRRGLTELSKAQIIAKTMRQGRYWINPNFVFNGDRIAFTTLIERKKSEKQTDLKLDG